MTRNKKTSGFTLIELMIVVAIIAVIAAIAIPKLMSARISANENAAIATLRTIAGAQQQLQASNAMDTDGDGGGEYGFFGELAGVKPLRLFNGTIPAAGAAGGELNPPFLATAFGAIVDAGATGVVERQGYYFQIWLPTVQAAGVTAGVGEPDTAATPTPVGTWNTDDTELFWCCYAWPVQVNKTGNRAFFINQEGDVAGTVNGANAPGGQYTGLVAATMPAYGAAYDNNSMDEPIGFAAMGNTAVDTNIWTQVGN